MTEQPHVEHSPAPTPRLLPVAGFGLVAAILIGVAAALGAAASVVSG